jgi:putative pyruvate formate lyase activating enzyme
METGNSTTFQPAYLALVESGELEQRIQAAYQRLSRCELCAVRCRIDRRSGKVGGCRTGERARVSNFAPHFGEERVLSGTRGSGAIFFAGCNLRCQFCQNWNISQHSDGDEVSPGELAGMMLALQERGCHNINLVSPSHVLPMILAAVQLAAQRGLRLPLVYNTGGYDSLDSLRLLDGIIDIYMPDMKYALTQVARRYSKIINYPRVNQDAVSEMFRQVGDLQIDAQGLAQRGLLVRHLVLPNGLAGSPAIMQFLATQISKNTYINVMDQYQPAFEAHLYPSLNRPTHPDEYRAAQQAAYNAGLTRLALY